MNRKIAAAAACILTGMTAAVFPVNAGDPAVVRSPAAAPAPTPAAPAVPAAPAAPTPTAAPVPVLSDADLRAGDNAFARHDFPVAVSFYTKYLQNAEKQKNTAAAKTAYERLLDALVMSRLPVLAGQYLEKYEKRFPGVNAAEIAMWRGDILFLSGKYREAAALYRKLLPSLARQDPRRFRTMFAYGQTLEKLGQWKAASAQYEPLWQQTVGTALGYRAFIRLVLCLAADRRTTQAWDLLLKNPPASAESKADYPLLAAYIALKQSGVKPSTGAWLTLLKTFPKRQDSLVYLTASAYGDAFLKEKEFDRALSSYRAAFHAAADKNEMFETLNRMISAVSLAEDRVHAADLAMSQLDLFKDSLLTPAVKLRTAKLLQDAGKVKGALALYESVFANMNSSDAEKQQAVYEYALLQCRAGHFSDAEKTMHAYFPAGRKVDGEFLLAEIFVRLKKSDLYIRKYESIAEQWPDRAVQAYLKAASACLDHRLPDQVLAFLQKLNQRSGGFRKTDVLYLEAAARAQKNQRVEALKLYNEFLNLADKNDPLVPQALFHSGLLAFSMQNMSLAAKRLSRFRKEFPRHALTPQAASWLIQVYAIQNDVIAAERETWLLAEQYPDSEYAVDALFRLASHYAEEGAREKAMTALLKLSRDSRFPRIQARAIYELANQAWKNGEKKTAVQYLIQLYEKFPESPVLADAWYLHGDILRSGSDFNSAIQFYRKVLEMHPYPVLAAAAHGSIGDCLLAVAGQDPAGRKNELLNAIQSYKTASELPGCPPAFEAMAMYRIGRCQELLGQHQLASEQYRKILYKFPASEAKLHPVETVWCVRAAEALADIAGKYPLRSTLRHARFALHWLTDAGMLPLQQAAERFDKLKNRQFNP